MKNTLITRLNDIVQYGLFPDLNNAEPERHLERALVKLYDLCLNLSNEVVAADYPEVDRSLFPDVRVNVTSNFKKFGYYKTFLHISDVYTFDDHALGDAIDDVADIIGDLLEVRWRIEHVGLDNGLWFLHFTFHTHMQQHILGVLTYMHQKNR